ncbi:hypothetical protein EOL99_03890 [Candidatus Falkowbacteria bacterium]|nr:hypothetical protein [Candidatus Falkowbacteria bacterium]
MFKVEIRTTCKICGGKLGHRQRTFCSDKCRNRSYAIKSVESGYGKEKEVIRLQASQVKTRCSALFAKNGMCN